MDPLESIYRQGQVSGNYANYSVIKLTIKRGKLLFLSKVSPLVFNVVNVFSFCFCCHFRFTDSFNPVKYLILGRYSGALETRNCTYLDTVLNKLSILLSLLSLFVFYETTAEWFHSDLEASCAVSNAQPIDLFRDLGSDILPTAATDKSYKFANII